MLRAALEHRPGEIERALPSVELPEIEEVPDEP
jgi:hypothetical protein